MSEQPVLQAGMSAAFPHAGFTHTNPQNVNVGPAVTVAVKNNSLNSIADPLTTLKQPEINTPQSNTIHVSIRFRYQLPLLLLHPPLDAKIVN